MISCNRAMVVMGLAGVAISLPASCFADFFYELNGEVLNNDNVGRAKHEVDIREDISLSFNAGAGYFYQPGAYTSFTLLGSLGAEKYDRYDGMDNINLGFQGTIGHKFGIGDDVPSLDVSLGIDRNTFDDGVRDAWLYSASATLTRRLGGRLFGGIGLSYETRDGDHDRVAKKAGPDPGPGHGPSPGPGPGPGHGAKPGDAFSTDSVGLFAFADLDLTELTWLSAGYQFADGEVTSTSTPTDSIVAAASAITNDRVFSPGQFAYRLDARTHRYSLDWNRAIMETGTLLIGVEYQDIQADSGVDYSVTLFRAGLMFSF